MLIYKDCELSL